jgi:glycosyltransferase involved in cell wall biosynthesis
MRAAEITRAQPPQVSIVLPAFNRADSISPAIQSVLRQTWQDFELIVVDDGSSDGTAEVARRIEDTRIKVIALPQNMGVCAARNAGIDAACGKWVAFQDSDDEWLPEKLSLQMARLGALDNPWIGAYCGMIIISANSLETSAEKRQSKRTSIKYWPASNTLNLEGDISQSLLGKSLISTQTLIARRDILDAIGGFDTDLSALVDWDLALRMSECGEIAFIDEPLVIQRFSENSITRDRKRRVKARRQVIAKHHNRLTSHPKAYAEQLQILAGEERLMGNFKAAKATMRAALKFTPFRIGLWIRLLYMHSISWTK